MQNAPKESEEKKDAIDDKKNDAILEDIQRSTFQFTHTYGPYAKISESGTRIKTAGPNWGPVMVTSSTGWNKGKHKWSLKCISIEENAFKGISIGITTDYSHATQQFGKVDGKQCRDHSPRTNGFYEAWIEENVTQDLLFCTRRCAL